MDFIVQGISNAIRLLISGDPETYSAVAATLRVSSYSMAASLVIAQIVYRLVNPTVPSYEVMSIFSVVGLIANGLCLFLLWRHRQEDINMSSVFECSRNDIAANLSVILAAIGVWIFDSGLPDIIIATLLAALLLSSSARVIKGAMSELAQA